LPLVYKYLKCRLLFDATQAKHKHKAFCWLVSSFTRQGRNSFTVFESSTLDVPILFLGFQSAALIADEIKEGGVMSLKRLTQSVTAILVVVIVVATAFVMGKILDVTGVTDMIDSLWSISNTAFLVALLISRWAFAAVWALSDYHLIRWLHRTGWFWFPPDRPTYYEEDPIIDKSGLILGVIGGILGSGLVCFLAAEIVIRLTSNPESFDFLLK